MQMQMEEIILEKLRTREHIFPEMYEFDIVRFIAALPETTEEIDVKWNRLSFLPSLRKFKWLKRLDCSSNLIAVLPDLPDSLEVLLCRDNLMISIPKLPRNLRRIDCSGNRITRLPRLNGALTILYCTHNLLESLPEFNPRLVKVKAYNNRIRLLPAFNRRLTEIDVSANRIANLPAELNEGLETLYCGYNQITEIPKINKRLKILNCNFNRIRALPANLENLAELCCDDNEISFISGFGNLQRISCSYNNLHAFPPISHLVTKLNLSHNPMAQYILRPTTTSVDEIRDRIDAMNRFKLLYFSLKLKSKLKKWLNDCECELVIIQ